MRQTNFGIEIEMTGLTRSRAANIAPALLEGNANRRGDGCGTYEVKAADGRVWKLMSGRIRQDHGQPRDYERQGLRRGNGNLNHRADVRKMPEGEGGRERQSSRAGGWSFEEAPGTGWRLS